MKLASPFSHSYVLVNKEYVPDRPDGPLREEIPRNEWRQLRVSLPLAASIFGLQLLLWIVSILYLLHRKGEWISLPIDKRLRDNLGNYYPAAEAVKYEIVTFEDEKIYMTRNGLPTSETDQAWLDLLGSEDGMLQASYDDFELDSLPQSIASKINPKLHMYGLEMFHQLHCLNMVRKSFYPEHYFANKTADEISYHREHCLDHIRQSLMCGGDFSLDYWRYDPETNDNWLRTDVPHVCRDFRSLQKWVLRHRPVHDQWLGEEDLQKTTLSED